MTSPVAPPSVDLLPTSPDRLTDSPEDFVAKVTAWYAAWPTYRVQMVDLAAATHQNGLAAAEAATDLEAAANAVAAATNLLGRSSSTLTVGAGTKTIAFTAPASGFAAEDQVCILLRSDPSIRMFGTIATSPAPTASAITVDVVSSGVIGAGEFSNWLVVHAAFLASGATAAEILAGVTDAAGVTPKGMKDARAFAALTDAATVAPDGNNGRNFTWTIGGNRTLGAIANCSPGQTYFIEITQDATGGRDLAWASGVYYRVGGLPSLSDTPGAVDWLQIKIKAVNGSGVATKAYVAFGRAPTN